MWVVGVRLRGYAVLCAKRSGGGECERWRACKSCGFHAQAIMRGNKKIHVLVAHIGGVKIVQVRGLREQIWQIFREGHFCNNVPRHRPYFSLFMSHAKDKCNMWGYLASKVGHEN